MLGQWMMQMVPGATCRSEALLGRRRARTKDRATALVDPHNDSFHDAIRCRGACCSTNHLRTPCGSNLQSSALFVILLPLIPNMALIPAPPSTVVP
ncbi:hypothetical protein AVEN_209187-1 [Araneus ventricosus]|uniref:Uncharacterized protein n=1 Tax=Araneus ventricosus TaxID=182803 RepID=A0A4Y2TAT6_ARAVE|nr:hypothetical protein AVEN_209187-1 [Araneus ventricosus]